jgi:hypothetical protein
MRRYARNVFDSLIDVFHPRSINLDEPSALSPIENRERRRARGGPFKRALGRPLFVEGAIIAFGGTCNSGRITAASTTCRDHVPPASPATSAATSWPLYAASLEAAAIRDRAVRSDNQLPRTWRPTMSRISLSERQLESHVYACSLRPRNQISHTSFSPRAQWLPYFPHGAYRQIYNKFAALVIGVRRSTREARLWIPAILPREILQRAFSLREDRSSRKFVSK